MTGKYNRSFLFSLSDISCVLNSAGQHVRQVLSSLPDISTSLPDMSGIFRDHCLGLLHLKGYRGRLFMKCKEGGGSNRVYSFPAIGGFPPISTGF